MREYRHQTNERSQISSGKHEAIEQIRYKNGYKYQPLEEPSILIVIFPDGAIGTDELTLREKGLRKIRLENGQAATGPCQVEINSKS